MWPTDAAALVQCIDFAEPLVDRSDRRGIHKPAVSHGFVPKVEQSLKAMGLGEDETIVLIRRSGDRSSKAADCQWTAGHMQVCSVAEGLENDA